MIHPGEEALRRPYGDHTGYYNEQAAFPVFTIERITMRRNPIYHSTYTGKPPDEPGDAQVALNEVFVPLPPEAVHPRSPISTCRRKAVRQAGGGPHPQSSTRPRQAGDVRHLVFCASSCFQSSSSWSMTTSTSASGRRSSGPPPRGSMPPATPPGGQHPIDYLDFASPVAGLGSKMGLDATNKWQR